MLFWMNYNIRKAIPALHKLKKSDVNKGYIKKTVSHTFKKAFCRHSLRGSMTVEASIVIPMVFFVWMTCISWTSLVYVHESVQQELGRTALELSVAAGKSAEDIQNAAGFYTWMQIFEMNNLTGGAVESVYGFDFSESQILENEDSILIKVKYKVRILNGLIPIPLFRMSNQVYVKAWTGNGALKNEADETLIGGKSVYVAEHGSVYHVDPMCSYIHLTIHMIGEEETERYLPCEKCMQNGMDYGQTFYITEKGEHYHSRLGCSGLKRQVSSICMTEVMTLGYEACSRCGGER